MKSWHFIVGFGLVAAVFIALQMQACAEGLGCTCPPGTRKLWARDSFGLNRAVCL